MFFAPFLAFYAILFIGILFIWLMFVWIGIIGNVFQALGLPPNLAFFDAGGCWLMLSPRSSHC